MLFIFDWDGTVIDSINKIVVCMQAAMQETGLDVLPRSTIQQIIGLGMHEATDHLFPNANTEQKAALQQSYAKHFVKADEQPCDFYVGCLDFIRGLRERGHLTAVATGKSRRGLDRVWSSTGQGHLFDASRCADETASKPNPLMLQQLLEQLDAPRHEAVMIGDTDFDLNMASAAGMRSVGVSFGAHSIQRLESASPAYIANSYAELQQWFDNNYLS